MTEQEKLFAQFFNSEKLTVANMSLIELRAHREELAKIAFEARARLTAVDDEERGRKAKKSEVTGFSRSVQTDELTSNAINQINDRKKKLSKQEKTIESLKRLGIDTSIAEHLVSNSNIVSRLKETGQIPATENPSEFTNPFARNEEPKTEVVDVSINEDTDTIIVREEKVPSKPFNPFAK